MAEDKWMPYKFEGEEEIAIMHFIKFSRFPLTKRFFIITAATEYGTVCDVVSENETGGTIITEIKIRKYKGEDCFIEPDKLENLLKLSTKGIEAFYLNYVKGIYYLWVLATIPENRQTLHKGVKIKTVKTSENNKGYKIVDRIGLQWEDAWAFNENGELIQKPKDFVAPNAPKHHNIDFNKIINNSVLHNL